jgi:hypothetical protein
LNAVSNYRTDADVQAYTLQTDNGKDGGNELNNGVWQLNTQ